MQKEMIGEIETTVGQNSTPSGEDNRIKFVGLCGLFVLYNTLFLKTDPKLFRRYSRHHYSLQPAYCDDATFKQRMFELCKKVPNVTLFGSVLWFPDQFLYEHLPVMMQNVDKKQMHVIGSSRHQALQSNAQSCIQA